MGKLQLWFRNGGNSSMRDLHFVMARLRPGLFERAFVNLEPHETTRLEKASTAVGTAEFSEALVPLVHKGLGWFPDKIPPGPAMPNRKNRDVAARCCVYEVVRYKLDTGALPLPSPDLVDFQPDMPLTLAEACRLVFRDHIKPATLRAEARRGHLIIERIGRRDFVTLAALAEMRERCRVGPA